MYHLKQTIFTRKTIIANLTHYDRLTLQTTLKMTACNSSNYLPGAFQTNSYILLDFS